MAPIAHQSNYGTFFGTFDRHLALTLVVLKKMILKIMGFFMLVDMDTN